MKHKFFYFAAVLCLAGMALTSCQPDNAEEYLTPIRIGKGESLTHISINRDTERHLILTGGNGKYRAYSSDRRLMDIKVHHDTLKVKALLEGEAYATIHSHDQSARLDVSIIAPELTFSRDTVRLYPKEECRYVSLFGGGDIVKLSKDDPEDILTYRWDGKSNVLEIDALYEGQATITATTVTGEQKHLKVYIKPVDEPGNIAIYGTGGKFYSSSVAMPCRLCVVNEGEDIVMSNVCNPHGGNAHTYTGTVLHISPVVNPKVGERCNLKVTQVGGPDVGISSGTYDALIEEIRGDEVILRSRRHKFVLPYTLK